MSNHWQEAQKEQREKTGTNAVFLPNEQATITGYEGYGWLLVTPELSLSAQTAQGVELVLEELDLPLLGWE